MAKKTGTVRVHHIAKELGVSSKVIVEKCQTEGIPGVTNHMSTVKVGLAATIREWYDTGGAEESATATAVEAAPQVEVAASTTTTTRKKTTKKSTAKKAKRAARKKTTSGDSDSSSATSKTKRVRIKVEAPDAPTPTATPTATPPTTRPAEEAPAELTPAAEAPVEVAPIDVPVVEAPAATAPDEPVMEAPAADAPAPTDDNTASDDPSADKPAMNVPERPTGVAPAGPMLEKPKKTTLSGPKIIRVEQPDVIPAPRPRAGGQGGGGPRQSSPGGRGVRDFGPDAPAAPGRGGDRGGSRTGRNKRRSASGQGDNRTSRNKTGMGAAKPFNWREQDLRERANRLNRAGGFFSSARRDSLKRSTRSHQAKTPAQAGGKVRIDEPITIKTLSAATGVKTADILKSLMLAGKPATINAGLDAETAAELMVEYDIELEVNVSKSAEEIIVEQFEQRDAVDERPRSPVVTILGHVDHGKTTLLDSIRKSNVAEGEAGGITQATSAFRVPVSMGETERMVTFIDTPGHEAFTEMRSRGAKVTDVVVLVVAADDGVMPQTIESISHAKAAGVPIVVALNKVDKPEATDSNIQRILGQLAEHELNPTDWGGDTEVIRISALKGEGIQDILDILDFQTQLLELKADFGGAAEGTVIESQVEEGRGPVARLLVQQGELKRGDFIVAGRGYGRVRDITNDRGKRIETAGPSTPIAVSGLGELPDAGDKFYIVDSLRAAESAADERRQQERERDLATDKVTLDNIFEKLSASGRKELPLIVKADVQGSLETLKATVQKISTDEVTIAIKHAAVGGVNDGDIMLAEASGAIIVGFNVTSSSSARRLAEQKGVDIRFYDVIYDLTDDITKAAEGLLEPELKLEVLGHAEVREVFRITKVGMVAGCYVTDGTVERNAQIRVTRDGIVVEKDRRLQQLKRFKDDAKDVRAGQECGMLVDGYDDIKVGDVIECYKTLEVRRKLS